MNRLSKRLRRAAFLLLALPITALAQHAYTTRTLSMRAGPSPQYPLVGRLGGGAAVTLAGCLGDWSWCDVIYGNLRGWVYGPYLNYVYRGGPVPLYAYAPSLGIPIIGFSIGPYWDRYYRGRPWYGRRDYWISRPPPQHVRPPGPPPRPAPPPPPRAQPQPQPRPNPPRAQPYNPGGAAPGAPVTRGSPPQTQAAPPVAAPPAPPLRGTPQAAPATPPARQAASPAPAPTAPATPAPPARQTLQPTARPPAPASPPAGGGEPGGAPK